MNINSNFQFYSLRFILHNNMCDLRILFYITGVRDYIHVMDLASGHVAALKKLKSGTHYQVRQSLT